MKFCIYFLTILFLLTSVGFATEQKTENSLFEWEKLTDLPHSKAGTFTGTHNNALIVAGGYIDGKAGESVFTNSISVLEEDAQDWLTQFELDYSIGYGASVTTDDGLVLIGGTDGKKYFKKVVLLKWNEQDRKIEFETLPDLPQPCLRQCCFSWRNNLCRWRKNFT